MREKAPVDFQGGGALGECLAIADADAAADGMVMGLGVARWRFEGCGGALVSGRVTQVYIRICTIYVHVFYEYTYIYYKCTYVVYVRIYTC